MILDIVRACGLSAWLTEVIRAEGGADPTPQLDRLRRSQEELAGPLVDHLRGPRLICRPGRWRRPGS